MVHAFVLMGWLVATPVASIPGGVERIDTHGVIIGGEPDCDLLRAGSEALGLVAAATASLVATPGHLAQAQAALDLATRSSGMAQGCGDDDAPRLNTGWCAASTSDHTACSRCCETDTAVAGMTCELARLCVLPDCRSSIARLCGKVVAALNNACIETNCTGKPGDPTCYQPPPPCPFECKFKCGLTQKGACGDCSFLNPDFVCCGG